MSLIWDPSTEQTRRASLAEAEARFLRERAGVDRKERLAAWREWAAKKLAAEFALPADPVARARLIGQCTAELERLRAWLVERGVTHVAMESTGIYWRPLFNVLEEHCAVVLANAAHVKAVPGRKTDVRLRHEVVSVAVALA